MDGEEGEGPKNRMTKGTEAGQRERNPRSIK